MPLFFSKIIFLTFLLVFAGLNSQFSLKSGFSADYSFAANDAAEKEMLIKRDLAMSTRKLIELLREQKAAYSNKFPGKKNDIQLKVEDLINEANYSASQDDYPEAEKYLDEAWKVTRESIHQLH